MVIIKQWWGEETDEKDIAIEIFLLLYSTFRLYFVSKESFSDLRLIIAQVSELWQEKIKAIALWRKHRCFLFSVNHLLINT